MRCQKVPKFDFQSQFSWSKIIGVFLNLFFIEKYQFRSTFFVITVVTGIFKSLFLLKSCPIFDSSTNTNSQNSIILFGYVDF